MYSDDRTQINFECDDYSSEASAVVASTFMSLALRATTALMIVGMVAFILLAALPHTGLYRVYSVLSGSMAPSFSAGDMVLSTSKKASDVRPGQVISFHAPIKGNPVVTHRVTQVSRTSDSILVETKGDSNPKKDAWKARIPLTEDVWTVRQVVPGAGRIMQSMHANLSRTILWIVVGLALAVGIHGVWTKPLDPDWELWLDESAWDDLEDLDLQECT